jgi:hypothetical protein
VLQIVVAVNAAMVLLELGAELFARSTAATWTARATLLEGGLMALFAVGVFGQAARKLARGSVPGQPFAYPRY